MLRRPKHSKIEVVAPKEEEELIRDFESCGSLVSGLYRSVQVAVESMSVEDRELMVKGLSRGLSGW